MFCRIPPQKSDCFNFFFRAQKNKVKTANAQKQRNYRERKVCDAEMLRLRHNNSKQYTEADNRQAVLTYLHLKRQGFSGGVTPKTKRQLVQEVSELLVRGRRLLWRVISHYETTNGIYVSDNGPRGQLLPCFCDDL